MYKSKKDRIQEYYDDPVWQKRMADSSLIAICPGDLRKMINEEIDKREQEFIRRPIHDTISLVDAINMLDEYGMSTSKAKIYKLTSAGAIPHRKYGNKLVFSRKELTEWMEEQIGEMRKSE